jgi:hypothetical protein
MCVKRTRRMIDAIVLASLLVVLTGCASQRNLVRCDGRLEPINVPAARTLDLTFNEEQANAGADRE